MADRVSSMAQRLVGSEIIRIAADVREMISQGRRVCNLTVGDFDPTEFPIPEILRTAIVDAIQSGETNYPPADGMPGLRDTVAETMRREIGIECSRDMVVVTSGSRPGIFATYASLMDPGDIAVYPVPSWNNNHYTHLVRGRPAPVVCGAATEFLPTRESLEPAIRGARLLVLNSPLNPAGTMFTASALEGICDLVIAENRRRSSSERPLLLLYDQVYRQLITGEERHVHPVALRPDMADFTITVDGISKAFAATGLRVGWAAGPPDIIERMSAVVAHVGAWAPRAEQIATAGLLRSVDAVAEYHATMNNAIRARLDALYGTIVRLREREYPVDAIRPAGAIYLSARFELEGYTTSEGTTLRNDDDVRHFLLDAAGIAVVPFSAFGMEHDSGWFRLSVGAVSVEEIADAMRRLDAAFGTLTRPDSREDHSAGSVRLRPRHAPVERARARRK